MDADWYVDPLDRFDGRFFDGDRWTERVRNDGKMAIDPEFASQTHSREWSAPAAPSPNHVSPSDTTPEKPVGEPAPVAAPVDRRMVRPGLPAADIAESPVRTLVVLENSGDVANLVPNHRLLAWALVGLVAALAIVGLLMRGSGDDATNAEAGAVELAEEQVQRVDDLESGGVDDGADETVEDLDVAAPAGAVEADAAFGADELIEVGALRVLNGTSALQALEAWHGPFAAARGIELGDDAGCWFGQLAGAAVQVAHCGPVGGSADTEYLYDSVPLGFEDVPGGQIAQPVKDAATIDGVLANALTLIGPG